MGNASCQCTSKFKGQICETERETQTDEDDNFTDFATSTAGISLWASILVLLILLIVLIALVVVLRRSRAKTGEYQPRDAETKGKAFSVPIEFADLQLPKEERLI